VKKVDKSTWMKLVFEDEKNGWKNWVANSDEKSG